MLGLFLFNTIDPLLHCFIVTMLKKYLDIQSKFQKLESALQDPVVIGDAQKLKEASKEYNELAAVAEKIKVLQNLEKNLAETELVARTETELEMRHLAGAETAELKTKKAALEK